MMLIATLLLLFITYTVYHYLFSPDSIVVVKKELDTDKEYGVPWVGGFTFSLARRLAPWKSLGRESQYLEESYNKVRRVILKREETKRRKGFTKGSCADVKILVSTENMARFASYQGSLVIMLCFLILGFRG